MPWLPAAPYLPADRPSRQRLPKRLPLHLGGPRHTTKSLSSVTVTTICICTAGNRSRATPTCISQACHFYRRSSPTAYLNTIRANTIIWVPRILCTKSFRLSVAARISLTVGKCFFNNLELITDGVTADVKLDFYDGTRFGAIDVTVRNDLNSLIIPSYTNADRRPAAPNFFLEAKAP